MKRWTVHQHQTGKVNLLAKTLGISPLLASVLISRGYENSDEAYKFLNPKYEDLHEPNLLKGMKASVKRIQKAIENEEKILIWGDYDVDGTTGIVVLRKALEILGAKTDFYVPHRFTEGYGINIATLRKAKERGHKVVISVDCGMTSFSPIDWAKENNLDVIVTDHHLAKEIGSPDAYAVINPNQSGCEYPDKDLAGVGVAFKLAHALLREKGKEHIVPHFLKMVAIGTIGDCMRLTGENRVIVSIGLKDLPNAKNFGLKALMEVSNCRSETTSYHVGFRMAPLINAVGRMDEARHVVELFEADNFGKAKQVAEYLNKKNIERQNIQKNITERVLLKIKDVADQNFVVVAGESWHRGVIGLAASRIAERFYKPTVVISIEKGIGYGSARGISDYHILEGLDTCKDLLEQYGGHAAAAGIRISAERINELRARLNIHAGDALSEEKLIPELKIDAEVNSEELNLKLVNELKQLEPFGQGNPKPIFATRQLNLVDDPWVMKEKHLKLKLKCNEGEKFEAVWWDGVKRSEGQTIKQGNSIKLAYTPEANTWLGNTRLQLIVKDLRKEK